MNDDFVHPKFDRIPEKTGVSHTAYSGFQLVKKVLTDFFDKLLSKLQNRNKEDYFAILPAAAG